MKFEKNKKTVAVILENAKDPDWKVIEKILKKAGIKTYIYYENHVNLEWEEKMAKVITIRTNEYTEEQVKYIKKYFQEEYNLKINNSEAIRISIEKYAMELLERNKNKKI